MRPRAAVRRVSPAPRPSGSVWRWLALAIVVVALGSGALALLGRSGAWGLPDPWGADLRKAAAVLVFSGTYVVIAVGKLPGLHIDRAGVALLGASLMVGCGALTLEDAYRAIDLDTITLLLGMMIVIEPTPLRLFPAGQRLGGDARPSPGIALVRQRPR